MENSKTSFNVPALIIAAALIVSTIIAIFGYYQAQTLSNVLSVTGSAKKSIESDRVRFVAMYSRNVYESDLRNGYVLMNNDLSNVKKYFGTKGIKESDMNISAVSMDQVYKQNDIGPKEYTLRQTIEISSSDLAVVTDLAKNTLPLINQGILFTTQSLEYSYSKLPELRVSLLADALADAKARANALATASGSSVGDLRSASIGVVQVLAPDSVDVSDYGAYDTSGIKKDVMVTVKASFSVN